MLKVPLHIPASSQDRKTAIKKYSIDDDVIDFIKADMALGLACQEHCHSRDDLADFALRNGLAPYLKPFLQRRGWLDDEWCTRLESLSLSFLHQVN